MPKTRAKVTRQDRIEEAPEERKPHPRRPTHIQPKNAKQDQLLRAIDRAPITIALGPAGVGKTYVAASKIANLYLSGKYDKIVLSRSAVGPGKSVGFFPGDINDKLGVWLMPVISVLKQHFGLSMYNYLLSKDIISYQPEECIRGMSFENSLVLVDEIQNCDWPTIKAISTRLGENSKMVWMGDVAQSDVNSGQAISKFSALCEKHSIDIPVVQFDSNDIVRSDIVGSIVRMLEKEKL